MTRYLVSTLLLILFSLSLYAEDKQTAESSCSPKLESTKTITEHEAFVEGQTLKFEATAGTLVIPDQENCPKASVFYVAYTKQQTPGSVPRPIVFSFNGGPGSSSVWLHLGAFGPKRIAFDKEGMYPEHPVRLIENPYTLLDLADLVFIDPVSTGHSHAETKEGAKHFHHVENDIKSIAQFIRTYVSEHGRWDSPKYIAGESYGTTRAAGLAHYLQEKYYMYLDGVILISPILNFQTIMTDPGNDLPYAIFLPSYASAAWYHGLVSRERYPSLNAFLGEVTEFVETDYAQALMKGDALTNQQKQRVVEQLMRYTGLSKNYLERSRLRVHPRLFYKALLPDSLEVVGRFDARVVGVDEDPMTPYLCYDPSLSAIVGAYTQSINAYLYRVLDWQKPENYEVLVRGLNWDFSSAENKYLNTADELEMAMTKNPRLRVFVAAGIFDLATPFYCADYTFAHMGLKPQQRESVFLNRYIGGHMLYQREDTLKQLKQDLTAFFNKK
ncbi:MAG: peptidase S10 [Chlamydiales bacterium]